MCVMLVRRFTYINEALQRYVVMSAPRLENILSHGGGVACAGGTPSGLPGRVFLGHDAQVWLVMVEVPGKTRLSARGGCLCGAFSLFIHRWARDLALPALLLGAFGGPLFKVRIFYARREIKRETLTIS